MSAPKVSVKKASTAAKRQADDIVQAVREKMTADSFQNFGLNLGQGTDNALSDSTYGFNPITRQRTLLEWIHRGSWLGGVAVDLVADDMTRAGVEFGSKLPPEDGERLHSAATQLAVWDGINDAIRGGRLYGGAIAVMLIEGQRTETPLRLETLGRGQFRGLYVFDRYQVEPSLNDLVTELGPALGMPKFYQTNSDGPALRGQKIHYSRCLRLEGTRLPWNQRIAENMWGLSVYERLYDRMVAFDSATQGAAQLVYKSALRTYKLKQMRELIGGDAEAGLILLKYVEMMRRFQGIEGITLIDADDDFVVSQNGNFAGIAEALVQFGQQIAGALQIPLVRLFGQSPAGLNSSGESDIVTYYDGIKHQQERWLKTFVERIYRAIASSEGIKISDQFAVNFRPLWQLTDEKKAAIANQNANSISTIYTAGIIGIATALKELKQQSATTGLFTNITEDEVHAAEAEPLPGSEEAIEAGKQATLGQNGGPGLDEEGVTPGAEPEADATPEPPAPKAQHNVHVHDEKSGNLFEEDEHPRGEDGKWIFAGGSSAATVKLQKVKKPTYSGSSVETVTRLSKLETGAIGESVVIEHLRATGLKDATALNTKQNNFPIDLMAGEFCVEVKSGLISNGRSAAQWRATIGQPGPGETAWLKTAGAEEKATWSAEKRAAIMVRKYGAVADIERLTGKKYKPKTITTIINPDTKTVDVYEFDDFHLRIAWNSPEAKRAYVGTYQYEAI